MLDNVTVILPSLDPDHRLNLVVDGCLEKGFKNIVIVNDGSDEAHLAPFEEAAAKPGVIVLTHECNKGKGRALKTAMNWVLENRKDARGVVTVDGDNQHHPDDVAACAEAMLERNATVLGCRDFSEEQVPWKSRAGNRITSGVFKFLFDMRISDTQTGLRAFPADVLPMLCECEGERFEYETNMLLEMNSKKLPITEVKIRTIYEDKQNSTSHFHAFRDSFRIYAVILKYLFSFVKYIFSSLAATLLDLGIFFVLNMILVRSIKSGIEIFGRSFSSGLLVVFLASAGARIVSSLFNYKINKHVVFRSDAKKSIIKYYILVLASPCISSTLVFLISKAFGEGSVVRTAFKALVDTILFFMNYRIQKIWVFKDQSNE
jgi:putative flippase GtrA